MCWRWREALEHAGVELSVWRIHSRIGMSGGLVANALLRETGRPFGAAEAEELQHRHTNEYMRQAPQVRALPGARELLRTLTDLALPWAIATSGRMKSAKSALDLLDLPATVSVVTRDQVRFCETRP
jgi:phosphoglycolate phosphatase-like HAD superfamily hydrolase